ncbi:MAG: PLD nuclease N-terminal domain-containing protein [Bacteroidales bacterium]
MDFLIILLISLATFLWGWAIYDINRLNRRKRTHSLWLMVVIFFPILGPILYFQLKKRY